MIRNIDHAFVKIPEGRKSTVEKNAFDPTPLQLMTSIYYLAYKFPDSCVVMPFKKINRRSSQPYHPKTVSLTWYEKTRTLRAPQEFWSILERCKDESKRFVIFPLTIVWKDGNLHANFMIYDKKIKTLERFEPYGKLPSPGLDKKLQEVFEKKLGEDLSEYYRPPNICPDDAFQRIQEDENRMRSSEDIAGYCQAWSTWYADLRLSNPDVSPKLLIEQSLKKIKKSKRTFTDFIRSYADFQNEWNEILLGSIDEESMYNTASDYLSYASSI